MTTIVADQAMQATWFGLKEQLEIRNEKGDLLGYFTPKNYLDLGHRVSINGEIPFTEEEMAEIAKRNDGPGRPLKDILADLEKLQ